eukprot:1171286-Prorocentrum_lima.AAC.1
MEGKWLIRHHRKPRRKTFHPDLRVCELSQFELEDFKAMICQPYLERGKKAARHLFKNYTHRKELPHDMGYWWIGSTWSKINIVIA